MNLKKLNTERLVQLCLSGDQSAQLEIYNRYYKVMYNASLRIVKDSFEAEDIMQDSFLLAFTKLKELKDVKIFGPWLKRIVINNSIHHYKKRTKHKKIALDDVLFKIEDNNIETYEDYDYINVKAKEVLNTMSILKDNYKLVLTLNLIEGYDYEEISCIMNISNANCRTTISRAKEALRRKLEVFA